MSRRIDLAWRAGVPVSVVIHCARGGTLRVRAPSLAWDPASAACHPDGVCKWSTAAATTLTGQEQQQWNYSADMDHAAAYTVFGAAHLRREAVSAPVWAHRNYLHEHTRLRIA